jgi:ribosomal protein S27E
LAGGKMKSKDVKQELTDETILCLHCGNTTLMYKCGDYKWGSNEDFIFSYNYKMVACPECRKITLIETYRDETMLRYDRNGDIEYYAEEKVLYPTNMIDNNAMPAFIKNSFESALKVRNIDYTGCLILLRRTLEMIVKNQGAEGKDLYEKIEDIANKGILPDALKEASTLARVFGNSAVHDLESIADTNDTNTLIELMKYIIEYLYIIPKKIDDLKRNIKE